MCRYIVSADSWPTRVGGIIKTNGTAWIPNNMTRLEMCAGPLEVIRSSHSCVLFSINLGIIEWILGKRNVRWTSFLTRDALENAKRYLQQC